MKTKLTRIARSSVVAMNPVVLIALAWMAASAGAQSPGNASPKYKAAVPDSIR